MGKKEERYINKLAKSIMGEIRLVPGEYQYAGANTLYDHSGVDVLAILRRMSPATLGRIAVCGKDHKNFVGKETTLYDILPTDFLSTRKSGKELLITIACATILAEIADILEAHVL